MVVKMAPGVALVAWLEQIPAQLRPPAPYYDLMLEAAVSVKSAQQAAVIYQMLGWAADYDQDPPPTSVRFPQDHRMHLKSGAEWYWFSCHLEAMGPDGPVRIAILESMERIRLLSNTVQAEAGWSDAECQVCWNAVTAVVSGPAGSTITRRSPNTQWLPLGGHVVFPSGDTFQYEVGPDSQSGSLNVLPLRAKVDDGANLSFDITLSTLMPVANAFFLQGDQGITPGIPGIYYSWPQLTAAGTVTVAGVTYEALGTAWIDHQLMAPPAPPVLPPAGINGWSWCEFNFDNGEAFTAAAFQTGAIGVNKLIPYGFYLRRVGDTWGAEPIVGGLAIDQLIPTLNQVMQPTTWSYTATNMPSLSPTQFPPIDVLITTAPWIADGSFETGDLGTPSEVPVSVAMVDRAPGPNAAPLGQALTGVGYCESVDYEPRQRYMERAAAFLRASL